MEAYKFKVSSPAGIKGAGIRMSQLRLVESLEAPFNL